MVKPDQTNPGKFLDETATSIKELIRELEDREIQGTVVTVAEIRKIARQLQGHVQDLLAASNNLRAMKSEVGSDQLAARDK